jgi:asparagine synthase (glutamine-hydrolysing)
MRGHFCDLLDRKHTMPKVAAIALQGLILHFNTLPSVQHINVDIDSHPLQPEINLTRYQPDNVVFTQIEDENCFGYCYGELLSYRSDRDTLTCLKQIALDWAASKLEHRLLNGRFVLLIWDKRSKEWTLLTDRLGAMHFYCVWQGDKALALGSDLASVARLFSQQQLDWEAIASFFNFGFFLGDRTYFTDINILSPCSIYRFDVHGQLIDYKTYWQWHHDVDTSRSYSDTIDAYHALLENAVKRSVQHRKPILPISGGLDSRSLAALMPRGKQTSTYSYGYTKKSIETTIATQIAETCGFTFTKHVISEYLFEVLPEAVQSLHGSQDITQGRQISINQWLHEHADTVLSGLWGDVWCDQMGLADGLPEGKTVATHTISKMQKRGRDWLVRNVARSHTDQANITEFLNDWMTADLEKYNFIEDIDFRVKAYKTSQWAFRWSNASLRAFEMGSTPRIPYYDVDIVDFFCTVPTEFVRDRRLQIDHLKRYAPDLARIRWQQADANLYFAKYGYWLGLPRRGIKKLRRKFTGERPIQRNWEVQFLSPEGHKSLKNWLLAPGSKLHEFVSLQDVSNLIVDFYEEPSGAAGYTVSMLLTFAVWLEICY